MSDRILELKKCPCCGGDPRVVIYKANSLEHPHTYFSHRYAIQCEYTGEDKGCGMESGHYKTLDEAIETWERRVEAQSITFQHSQDLEIWDHRVKELEEDIEQIKSHVLSTINEFYDQPEVVMNVLGETIDKWRLNRD